MYSPISPRGSFEPPVIDNNPEEYLRALLIELENEREQLLVQAKMLPLEHRRFAKQLVKEEISFLEEMLKGLNVQGESPPKIAYRLKSELFELRSSFANFYIRCKSSEKVDEPISVETKHPLQHLLTKTSVIHPANVRLRASMLLTVFSQMGTDGAARKKQDFIEWLEITLKTIECSQTLQSFFDCFESVFDKFPDISLLSKVLKKQKESLLEGVDEFQLLELLKQDAGEIISYEISRIYEEQRAKNAKNQRLRAEEEADAKEKCERLIKETGLLESSAKEEMANAAWAYLLHNMPSLFNDYAFVCKASSHWQHQLFVQEEGLMKHLLSSLNDSASPYSRLPSHIKNGVRTYLTSYKKENDCLEHFKLENKLISKPQIAHLENGGVSILRVTGGFLSLKAVLALSELANLKGIDEIQILTKETLFLDRNMSDERFRGVNLVLLGKTVDIRENVSIDTSGLGALPHAEKKARDGRSFHNSASNSGFNGENGKPGNPGGSAGHVHIQACSIIGANKLQVKANGGKGGDGQEGGIGDRGQDGRDGEDADYYNDGSSHHARRDYHIVRGTNGSVGQAGGKGGDGGAAGEGGYAGQVIIRDLQNDYVQQKGVNLLNKPGVDGAPGIPGEGGEAGVDGRRGLDSIVAFTGAFTFQKNKSLKGWDVFAKLIYRGMWSKDTYDVFARVSEYIVKITSRIRSRAHGQVGTRTYAKQSAAKKKAINISALLNQNPEVAANLKDSQAHNLMNQKLDVLFRLGERRLILNSERELLEKEEKVLSEKQQRLEETVQRIASEAIHQRTRAESHVRQMADPKGFASKVEEEPSPLPEFNFFMPKTNSEKEKNEISAFQRIMKIISESKVSKEADFIFEWRSGFDLFNNRLENDIEKIKKIIPEISQERVYESLEVLLKSILKKKAITPEDLIGQIYEMCLWHISEPDLIEKMIKQKKELFQCLMEGELLTEKKYSRLKFALSFMKFSPGELDELSQKGKKDLKLFRFVDKFYVNTFYKPLKEAFLYRCEALTAEVQERFNILFKNIFLEMKQAGHGIGYAESVRMIETLIRHVEELSCEEALLKPKLFEVLKAYREVPKKNISFGVNKEKSEFKSEIPKAKKPLINLPDFPFRSYYFVIGSEEYRAVKKWLSDFIEEHCTNSNWHALFEIFEKKLEASRSLPPIEEVYELFSMMALRENEETLLSDLREEAISNWMSKTLLGNIKEKQRSFLLKKGVDITEPLKKLEQGIKSLFCQPLVLNIFYQKLASETAISDSNMIMSIKELQEIILAFQNLKEESYDPNFISALNKTPLPAWGRVLRTRFLQQKLFDKKKVNLKDQNRCLISLVKLEENLGGEIVESLVTLIQKNENSINYALLADLLLQVRYDQLTLDKISLSLLEKAPFEKWTSCLLDYHKKEAERTRDLATFLELMQKEPANKDIDILQPKDGNPPVVQQQIQSIKAYLKGASHKLADIPFQGEEKFDCLHKSIDKWDEKDIFAFSSALQKREDCQKLVQEYLPEIVAIISQAVFLVNGFHPRDVQYLALLTAFAGSNHSMKLISQIATGQGKTLTGAMLAILRVLSGDFVDFVTSSSVLAKETEEEVRSIARIFNITTGCNVESNPGPYALELIEGEPTETQIEQIRENKSIAIIKKGDVYTLGFSRTGDNIFVDPDIDLSKWPEFAKKIKENPFQTHKCTAKDGLHEEVFKIIKEMGLQDCVQPSKDEILELQENYRRGILFGTLQTFMHAHLLTEFYDKNITQNRSAFLIMDEADRLLDEMRDILYLSHDIPDMHHLNNLLFAIWEHIHHPNFLEHSEENIATLTQYLLSKLAPGDCSTAEVLEGKILIPAQLEGYVRRRMETLVRSAYIAEFGLSKDGAYVVAQMEEGESRGVYLVDRDTGVTSKNKELSHGVHQFLRIKHQDWPKPLSLKAIYSDPISFLKEMYKRSFFMTGTIGTEQDGLYFEKLLDVKQRCIVPRHELLNLEVDPPILVSSFSQQMEAAKQKIQELRADGNPVEIICDSIADAKALTSFLKENIPDCPLYTRIHSFEPFSKGSRKDPIQCGEVIITTAISARGTDFHLDEKAEAKKLALIKFGVYNHERADKQVDGRTARKGLAGKLIHILCPENGEASLEEMQALRDLLQEQNLDQIRREDLHTNSVSCELFQEFSKLSKDVDEIICKSEHGKWPWSKGFIERQKSALRTHWAFWLDEIEQKMEQGLRDKKAIHKEFQEFRSQMLALAKEEGPFKFVTGASDITQLGVWFALENKEFTIAIECFDKVIDNFYQFSGEALYYKAFAYLNKEDAADFEARKKAAFYLRHARGLIRKEIERLQEPVGRMVALDTVLRKKGQGLEDSQFKKTVAGMISSLEVHLSAIDALIGCVTEPSFFNCMRVDDKEAQELFDELIKEEAIKGYRISKKVTITEDKKVEVLLANGRREEIKFPLQFNDCRAKIIDLLYVSQNEKRKERTLNYTQYCKLVFGETESTASEEKKTLMSSSWYFLQHENVINLPTIAKSRLKKLDLKKDNHYLSDSAWQHACGVLRLLDAIKMETELIENLSERGRIPMEVLSFFKQFGFDHAIRAENKPVRWNKKATFLLIWSLAQMTAGIILSNPALFWQGINDGTFVAMGAALGDFSGYLMQKTVSLGTAAVLAVAKPAAANLLNAAEKGFVKNPLVHKFAKVANMPKLIQNASSSIAFTKKVIDAVPSPVLRGGSKASFIAQFGVGLTEICKQTAVQLTMQYLLTTFCQQDLERSIKNGLGERLQLDIKEISENLKKTCMAIFEYSDSPEQAEKIILFLFESALKEHSPKRQNPFDISMDQFATNEMGSVFGEGVGALTGSKLFGTLTRIGVSNADKIKAVSNALFGAKSFMEDVQKLASTQLDKLKSTKKRNVRSEKERSHFDKFVDIEIQSLRNQIGNKSLAEISNTCIKPLVSKLWSNAIDAAFKKPEQPKENISDVKKINKEHPDDLLHAVWEKKEISGKELFKATKKLQHDWTKEATKDATILTTISLLYEKAAEKFIKEGNVKKAFKIRSFAAQAIHIPKDHPLYKMHEAIDKGTKKQADPLFGAFFSHLDSGVIKAGNVRGFNRKFTGKEISHCFEFKITHQSREKLERTIELIRKNKALFRNYLPKNLQGFFIKKEKHLYRTKNKEGLFYKHLGYNIEDNDLNAWKIRVTDKISATIVTNPELGSLYNNISVEINSSLPNEKKLEIFNQLFSVLGLGSIVMPKRAEDEERLKIAQLFRTYYPREAMTIERVRSFYEIPLEKLKKKIIDYVPDMANVFNKYLVVSPHLFQEEMIFHGKSAWSISDLSDQMREAGAYGLYATITAKSMYDNDSKKELEVLLSILKKGLISSQDRYETGMFIQGWATKVDFRINSADQVFTRLSTKNTHTDFTELLKRLNNPVILLIDLDAVNRGGYAYDTSYYGVRSPSDKWYQHYENRDNLIEFTKRLKDENFINEVMVKNRIHSKYITGLVVANEEFKEILMRKLKEAGIKEVNGKKLNDFIQVAKEGPVQKTAWDK